MTFSDIPQAIRILKKEGLKFKTPYVTEVSNSRKDPFKVLISCIISLRTKDQTTREASQRLFKLAGNPRKMSGLSLAAMEKAIYPAGFYRVKAKTIKKISKDLLEHYGGKVPDSIDELLKLNGVGRKTANLVVTMGFNKPGICVDTHVHRITNRWGLIKTASPEETEFELRKKLDKRHWIIFNDLLVTWGQNVCKPVSPLCGSCGLYTYCKRAGVSRQR